MKTSNAIITDVSLTIERGGILSAYVYLDYGSSCQGFGGHALYLDSSFTHSNSQINYAGHFMFRCMKIADVESWSKMKGKTVRAKYEQSKVYEIGHIVKDDWFNPEEEFKKLKESHKAEGK